MNSETNKVVIIKMNTLREELWRYEGRVLNQSSNSLLIEAFFNRNDLPFHGITLKENDRFIERYYNDRWYNIFEIHDWEDDQLKAWYCNITKPAEFSPGTITYIDLALDILVYPDNEYLVLDRDEFEALALDQVSRSKARHTLKHLVNLVENKVLTQMINHQRDA